MENIKRLPSGHRYTKQEGYKKGWFHNWAIFGKHGELISLGGRTKKQAREIALSITPVIR